MLELDTLMQEELINAELTSFEEHSADVNSTDACVEDMEVG